MHAVALVYTTRADSGLARPNMNFSFSEKSILNTDSANPRFVQASYLATGVIRPTIFCGAVFDVCFQLKIDIFLRT